MSNNKKKGVCCVRLYEYLEENLEPGFEWGAYNFDEAKFVIIKGNYPLLCDVWDHINQWAPDNADVFNGVDAALVVKILNETLALINEYTSKEKLSLFAVADLCSIYGKCCVFVKNEMTGTDMYEKCKFVVNNTIADCVVCKKEPCIEMEDVHKCNPNEDCWEEI